MTGRWPKVCATRPNRSKSCSNRARQPRAFGRSSTSAPPNSSDSKELPMIDLEQHYETLLLESPADAVLQLTLNRHDRPNAMTVTMLDELESVARAIADDRDVRVVILTGAGRAFCAGYDLDEAARLPTLGALGMLDLQERAARALGAVRTVPVPVIAAVNGAAAGGGMSLSL